MFPELLHTEIGRVEAFCDLRLSTIASKLRDVARQNSKPGERPVDPKLKARITAAAKKEGPKSRRASHGA